MTEKEGRELRKQLKPASIVETGRAPSYMNNSSAVLAPNGDIVLVCKVGSSHQTNDCRLHQWRSPDMGKTWEYEGMIAEDSNYALLNVMMGRTATGRLILFYAKYDNDTGTTHGKWMKYSDDNGKSWSKEINATDEYEFTFNYQNSTGKIILHPQNSHLYYADQKKDADGEYRIVELFQSPDEDNGKNWTQVTEMVQVSEGVLGEPQLLWTPYSIKNEAGRLICFLRIGADGNGNTPLPNDKQGMGLIYTETTTPYSKADWSDPIYYPYIPRQGVAHLAFKNASGVGLAVRQTKECHGKTQLYTSDRGLWWHKARGLVDLPTGWDSNYGTYVQDPRTGSTLLIYPVENDPFGRREQTIENEISGIYVQKITPEEMLKYRGKATTTVLEKDSLAGGSTTSLADCLDIPLDRADNLSITTILTFDSASTADPGARLHLRTSPNTFNYDTVDYTTADIPLNAGATVRKTCVFSAEPAFMKLTVENLTGNPITDLKIKATLW